MQPSDRTRPGVPLSRRAAADWSPLRMLKESIRKSSWSSGRIGNSSRDSWRTRQAAPSEIAAAGSIFSSVRRDKHTSFLHEILFESDQPDEFLLRGFVGNLEHVAADFGSRARFRLRPCSPSRTSRPRPTPGSGGQPHTSILFLISISFEANRDITPWRAAGNPVDDATCNLQVPIRCQRVGMNMTTERPGQKTRPRPRTGPRRPVGPSLSVPPDSSGCRG